MHILIKCRVLRRLIRFCTIANVPVQVLQIAPCHRSDKHNAAINNRYLDFIQTSGLILLVNDTHLDNNFKEI